MNAQTTKLTAKLMPVRLTQDERKFLDAIAKDFSVPVSEIVRASINHLQISKDPYAKLAPFV
jgi:hypothetical protein